MKFPTRLSAAVAAVLVLQGSAPAGETQEAQQQPLFRGGARFVRVDVYPSGRNGQPVEGLTARDFEVYEDGRLQQVATFEFVDIDAELEEARVDPNTQAAGEEMARDPRARIFVIVLDTKHVDVLGGPNIRRPLTEMLDRLIGPRDLFGVISPQLRPSDLILGRKTVTVADMLQRHWTWGTADRITPQGAVEQYLEHCFAPGGRTLGAGRTSGGLIDELIARHRERETLEHLDGLVAKLGAIRDEKKAVIVVTQGWHQFPANEAAARKLQAAVPGIYMGGEGGRISRRNPQQAGASQVEIADCQAEANALLMIDFGPRFRELLVKAQRANVSFYPVDPRGMPVFDRSLSQGPAQSLAEDLASLRSRRDHLMEFAENTDGMALISSNDLSGTLRRLSHSLSRYYLLGYYSTNTKFDGGYRRLEVKVRQPDVRLKARRGYFAPSQEELDAIASARAAAAVAPPAGAIALAAALGRLDEVRHDRDLFVQAARAGGSLVIAVELGVNARQQPAWRDGGDVRLMISAGAERTVRTAAMQPPLAGVTVRLPMDSSEDLRIDARVRSAAGAAADATLTLAAGSQALIGDVLSYRGIDRARAAAADGRYRRTERATIEAPLASGATPAGARVLDRAGRPLTIPIVARERIDAGSGRWMAAELVLAPLTEGDYVIELEAVKDDRRETKLFAIRVVR